MPEKSTEDSKRTLSLKTLNRTLSLRNIRRILSLRNLKGTLSLGNLKRTILLRNLQRSLKTIRVVCFRETWCNFSLVYFQISSTFKKHTYKPHTCYPIPQTYTYPPFKLKIIFKSNNAYKTHNINPKQTVSLP